MLYFYLSIGDCGDLVYLTFSMQSQNKQLANAEIRLSYRPLSNPVPINGALDAYLFFMGIWDKELIDIQEQFYVAFLNGRKEVICWRCLHTGTTGSTVVDVKMIFSLALSCFASGILIAHNHPSGRIFPSCADEMLTEKIASAAGLLELHIVDHIILGRGYYSFREDGKL